MKKLFFSIVVLFSFFYASGAGSERVCFVTLNGPQCNANDYGYLIPCASYSFVVDEIGPPPGYNFVSKFEWFANGVLVKTSTNASDPGLTMTISSKTLVIYCKVTYINSSNGTTTFTSQSLTPNIKGLNFGEISGPATTNLGCSNSLSFSLATFSCLTNPCALFTTTVGSYSITWQAPSGWVQTSISSNGDDVTYTPDATSSGSLIATITLPCGFSDTRTKTISRTSPIPAITASNPATTCNSTSDLSIDGTCGASNYTYIITGNTGVTFTSNSLQVLTTSSTTVNLTYPSTSATFGFKAKANYPGSVSSGESTREFYKGAVAPQGLTVTGNCPGDGCGRFGSVAVTAQDVDGATSYNWYKDAVFIRSTTTPNFNFVSSELCDVYYHVDVEAVTPCGTSAMSSIGVEFPACENSFMMSADPSPAQNEITVSTYDQKGEPGKLNENEKLIIQLYDFNSNHLVKQWSLKNDKKQHKLSVGDVKRGKYVLQILKGKLKQSKQIILN